MRILVVRSQPNQTTYQDALVAHGHVCESLEVTHVAPPTDLPALHGAARVAPSYHILGFASATAVQALASAMQQTHTTFSSGAHPVPVVVGHATANEVLKHFGQTLPLPVVAESANAEGLGAAIAQTVGAVATVVPRILLPRASGGRPFAAQYLRRLAKPMLVDEVIAYQTVARPRAALNARETALLATVQAGGFDGVALFAPSQVTALAGLLTPERFATLWVVAIGNTTAASARRAGATMVTVAASPSPMSVAQALTLGPNKTSA